MITKITEGVKISVETFYQDEYSQPLNNEFMFAYRITIENGSDRTVKLLRRHWYIFDSCGITREVEGEGVVGLQPVIEPGKSHQYVSGSHLKTEMGRMHGTYLMERMVDGKQFYVNIPEFQLVAPFKLN
ncbi:MAG: Co2+/Mg2+ efflux protein ApaG [Chitinophagaceae bacterium]|jgi:ApaG protein|nr:Co2+/Mg2+ efflux protein ApaG [Chitinophagaceae bacterium]